MKLRLGTYILGIHLLSLLAGAQSISTIFGNASNGVPALAATLNIPSAVATARNGDIYVALRDAHQVVRIDGSGKEWLVAGTGAQGSTGDGGPATAATLNAPLSLAFDPAGNLYIADPAANRIRRVGADGVIVTFAGTGKGGYSGNGGLATAATFNYPSAVACDSVGNLYIADSANHVVRKVAGDGIIRNFAGTGNPAATGNGGSALLAQLTRPQGLMVDSSNNVYIADTGNGWVRVVGTDGIITLFAGQDSSSSNSPFGGAGADSSLATNFSLSLPTGLAMDQSHNVYIVEPAAPRVLRVAPNGKITSYAGTGSGGSSGDQGFARFANLYVLGIGIDRNDNLLIADGINNRVRVVTKSDGVIDTIAGTGLGPLTPRGVALYGDYVYYSDYTNHCVRRINLTTGASELVAGTRYGGYTTDGVAATSAALNGPRGLAITSAGVLYIADSNNNRVRKVGTDGILSTVAGGGTSTTSVGDGGQATAAVLNEPAGVALDSSGNLYISERSGHRVRKVTSSQLIATVAGTGTAGAPDSETGGATAQRLNLPQGIAVDSSGNILIADSGNNRVRRVSTSSAIVTVAGTGAAGSAGDGGLATAAILNNPVDVTFDSAGNLYIDDFGNQKIRRVSTDGYIETVAGTGVAGFNGDGAPATNYSLNGAYSIQGATGCNVLVADSSNQRIRQLQNAIGYTIATNPPGLSVTLDGNVFSTPATVNLMPGTSHSLTAPSPQPGSTGVQYVPAAAQTLNVVCGPARASATLNFQAQYAVTVVTDRGGSVTPAAGFQTAGSSVTLTAAPQSGYAFAGWEGDCSGTGACVLSMTGPKMVKADFASTTVSSPAINANGVAGAGLSSPAVTALSPGGLAIVYGSGFAPAGTSKVADASNLVKGQISTEMDGVCVLVGSVRAPILALSAGQINFQTPQGLSGNTVAVQVAAGCGTANERRSAALSVALQSATPEFFSFTQSSSGRNPIAALDVNTGVYVGAPGLLAGATFAPAKPGDFVALFATGLGVTNPLIPAGEIAAAASSITGAIQVFVGATQVPAFDVLYAGVTPSAAGLYQINFRLPATTADGDQPIRISVNGIASPNGPYLTVKQ